MATVTKGRTFVSGETVTPAKLNDVVDLATVTEIVNADIKSDAAIALSKLATGALPTAITVATANILDANVTTAKIADANVTDAKLATGIDASKLTTGTLPIARIADAAVTPAKLSQPLTLATAQNTTSGTSIDFTDVPSWVKRITVMFNGVSTNGSSLVRVQVGSGSIATTGYQSTGNTPGATVNSTAGFATIYAGDAGYSMSGTMQILLLSGFTYVASSLLSLIQAGTGINITMGTGTVTLSGTLDRIRLTTVTGTDTFDAGSVNIMYEG
jgi:hypothetical protein